MVQSEPKFARVTDIYNGNKYVHFTNIQPIFPAIVYIPVNVTINGLYKCIEGRYQHWLSNWLASNRNIGGIFSNLHTCCHHINITGPQHIYSKWSISFQIRINNDTQASYPKTLGRHLYFQPTLPFILHTVYIVNDHLILITATRYICTSAVVAAFNTTYTILPYSKMSVNVAIYRIRIMSQAGTTLSEENFVMVKNCQRRVLIYTQRVI